MRVLVVGATSHLGSAVAAGLERADVSVRRFVRRAVAGADVVLGDLADVGSLERACAHIDRVFLMSAPGRDQVGHETNAIAAAEAAGVARIVKISNIPIPGLETGLHGNHRAIERRLNDSPVDAVVLQPSFFTTVVDRQRALIARGKLVLPTGAGAIAWIDPADIAAVAVEALQRDDVTGPLHLTGPEALDGDQVARRLGVQRLDPPRDEWRAAAVAGGLEPWLADSTVHLYEAVEHGALADVTDTVEHVTGHAPRRAFLTSG
jgi:NAD(P)H dehydrogenase (quinone)